MSLDLSFIDRNRASTLRMRDLAGRLSDEQLRVRVGRHWTVAIVFAHLAFWDRRVMYVLDMTERDGKLFVPEIDIFVNDLSLPLWAAIPPREAARIGVEEAHALDRRLEQFNQALLQEIHAYNKRWVDRSLHRGEHLQEVETALDEGFPLKLAAPALRALNGAGYTRLEQLARASESEISRLHGMGPHAMDALRRALADRGLSFLPKPDQE